MPEQEKKTIVLLNPPGKHKYLRDYYCSHISKARYYWAPYDLIVLSAQLKKQYNIIFIDAILDELSFEQTADKILGISDLKAVVFLTGGVSWKNDIRFMNYLKKERAGNKDFLLIGNGDVFLENGQEMMEKYLFIDAAITNFADHSLLKFLDGEKDIHHNLIYREAHDRIVNTYHKKNCKKNFSYPIPDYYLFPFDKYRLPHSINAVSAGLITSYGCPFKCDYCVGGKLPFMVRDLQNVYEELCYLKMIGIKELWIKDLTFGVPEQHGIDFCEMLIENNFNFSWICLSRVDVLNEELLVLMKKAGCHTIQIGVETASEELLTQHKKNTKIDQIRTVFKLCKKTKIRTLAHFILGLPGETEASIQKTIDFSRELEPDFASFNIIAPRMGTDLREQSISNGTITDTEADIDNSLSFPLIETEFLTPEQLWNWRNKAIRSFYLRPSYMVKRLKNLRSYYEFTTLFFEGWDYLKSTFRPKTEEDFLS